MGSERTVWLDLSTSLHWGGGVVGIVRAELELVRNLGKALPEARFVAFDGHAFVEIARSDLPWLDAGTSVADLYLASRDLLKQRYLTHQRATPSAARSFPSLERLEGTLSRLSHHRRERMRIAAVLAATAVPSWSSEFVIKNLIKARRFTKMLRPEPEAAPASPFAEWNQPPSDVAEPVEGPVVSPFDDRSLLLSFGWMDTGRERYVTALRKQLPGLKCAQLVYDVIPIHEDVGFRYSPEASTKFAKYFAWASRNSDWVMAGGENSRRDIATYQQRLKLPSPPSFAIRFGDATLAVDPQYDPVHEYYPSDPVLLRHLKVAGPYVLYVATIEARKNHAVLYEASRQLASLPPERRPLFVLVGRVDHSANELMDSFHRDPLTRDHVLQLEPSDHQLQVLYRNAWLCVNPSLYEGWSLTLPEALSFGRHVLAADVAPLREVGGDLVEYLPAHEPKAWADRIRHYLDHPEALKAREAKNQAGWRPFTWEMAALELHRKLGDAGALR